MKQVKIKIRMEGDKTLLLPVYQTKESAGCDLINQGEAKLLLLLVKAFKVKNSMQYTFKEETNPDLLRMAKAVHKFTYAYCPELKHQEVDSMDKFYSLWDGVCLKIAGFGYNYKGNTMV